MTPLARGLPVFTEVPVPGKGGEEGGGGNSPTYGI